MQRRVRNAKDEADGRDRVYPVNRLLRQKTVVLSATLWSRPFTLVLAGSAMCFIAYLLSRTGQDPSSNALRNQKSTFFPGYKLAKPKFYPLVIPPDARFPETCPQQLHTFEIANRRVRWASNTFSYMSRGLSVHCMLARAAKRLGNDFSVRIRIGVADVDLNSTLSFQPAAILSSSSTLLFPDSTFESWPETHDYSLKESVASVWSAALENGLPGTSRWKSRNPTMVWRGSSHGIERQEMVNASDGKVLDVQSTALNLTSKGLELLAPNKISRRCHCRHRFLLHMNGIFNNRYSSAVKWKLLCGSLVFVPTQPLFDEWWNRDVWQPYQHYVPYVSVEDLLSKIKYYEDHLDEAALIAKRGMELAMASFEYLNDFVDERLQDFAKATHHLDQPVCFPCDKVRPFKSLEELQKEYGPTVCA